MNEVMKRAKEFIYRNARPLDIARWQYHFENGSREAVLNALSYYRNEDGGFGHALEADSWNPYSSPIQTMTATEILREINFTDASHPIIRGILNYLGSGKDFDGHIWFNTIKSNNDYPHAPWWHQSDDTNRNNYNPTACLAGFIIKYAEKNSELYALGCRIAKEAADYYLSQDFLSAMHTVHCYVRLLEYVLEAGADGIFDVNALKSKLKEQLPRSITKDKSQWGVSYVCKPSLFFKNTESFFYADNKEMADYECEFIIKTQLEDGSWFIPWGWADYQEEWAVSKNWWKSDMIISNLLYLKGFNKI